MRTGLHRHYQDRNASESQIRVCAPVHTTTKPQTNRAQAPPTYLATRRTSQSPTLLDSRPLLVIKILPNTRRTKGMPAHRQQQRRREPTPTDWTAHRRVQRIERIHIPRVEGTGALPGGIDAVDVPDVFAFRHLSKDHKVANSSPGPVYRQQPRTPPMHLHRTTDRRTDGRTDGRTDIGVLPVRRAVEKKKKKKLPLFIPWTFTRPPAF